MYKHPKLLYWPHLKATLFLTDQIGYSGLYRMPPKTYEYFNQILNNLARLLVSEKTFKDVLYIGIKILENGCHVFFDRSNLF